MEKTLKPSLRFKGFTDTWEQRELESLANKLDNLRVPVSEVDRVPGPTPYYGANGIQGYVQGYTHKGEFILVAEDGANDLKNYPVQYVNGEVWVNNHAHVLQGKFDFADTKYLGYAISQTNIEPFLVGGGRAKLNASTMMKIMISTPQNTQEQQRIGSLFDRIDSLITLHQRKYDKLVNVKKALLDKMFPKNGELVPKLRFKGFTDTWEQCEVGKIFKVTRGYVLPVSATSPQKTENTPYPVYSSQTQNNGLMGYYKDYLFDTAITWTTDGANAGTVSFRGEKFYSTNVNGVLLSDKGYANKCVAEALNLLAWKHVSHVGNPKLMNNVMSEIDIIIPPTISEQESISQLLTKLDVIITLHQRKYEKLVNIKKALLQKMFV